MWFGWWLKPSETEIWCFCLVSTTADDAAETNLVCDGLAQSEPTGSLAWLQMSQPVGTAFAEVGDLWPNSSSDDDVDDDWPPSVR